MVVIQACAPGQKAGSHVIRDHTLCQRNKNDNYHLAHAAKAVIVFCGMLVIKAHGLCCQYSSILVCVR